MSSEISSLKESVAFLKAELFTMKGTLNESNKHSENVKMELTNDIADVRNEMVKCAEVIRLHANSTTDDGKQTLSDGIQFMCRKLSKLETARNNIASDVSNVKRSVQDNTTNISNMCDSDTANKNSYKLHIREIKDTVHSELKRVSESTVPKDEYDTEMRSLGSKIKNIESNSKTDTSAVIRNSLKCYSDEIGTKLDNLCTIMDINYNKLVNFIAHPGTPCHNETPPESAADVSVSYSQASGVSPEAPNCATNHQQSCLPSYSPPAVDNIMANTMRAPVAPTVSRDVRPNAPLSLQPRTQHNQQRYSPPDASDTTRYPPDASSQHSSYAECVASANTSPTTPVVIDIVTAEPNQAKSNSRFVGVVRKRAKFYMIGGIDLDSNEAGLHDFLVDTGITYKTAKFIHSNRTDCQVAQIVVDEDQAEILDDPYTWPDGMFCRPWVKPAEYRARRRARDNRARYNRGNDVEQ